MLTSLTRTTALTLALAGLAACEGGHPEFEILEYPDLETYMQAEHETLTTYAQVDSSKGIYRIPVAEALTKVAKDPTLLEPFGPVLEQQARLASMTVAEQGGYHFKVTYACAACHSLEGAKMVGPALNNRWGGEAPLEGGEVVAFNDAYFTESVLYSTKKIARGYQPVMPVFDGQMTDEHLEAIRTYLKQYQ